MKLKQFLGTLCAMCMLISAVAVPSMAAEERSTYAGATKPCQIVVATMDKGTEAIYNINVPIPMNATKSDEMRLVREAATATVNATKFRVQGEDLLSTSGAWTLPGNSNPILYVGGGTLQKTYATLYIQFENVRPIGSDTKLVVKVVNSAKPNATYISSGNIHMTSAGSLVYFINGDPYPTDVISFNKGNKLDIYAGTNGSGAAIDKCYVSLSTKLPGDLT